MTNPGVDRLIEGIVLGDRFQFFVVETEEPSSLFGALDEIQRGVEAAGSSDPTLLYLDPYVAHPPDRPLSSHSAITQVLGPLLRFGVRGASRALVVIDATRAPFGTTRDTEGWLAFFRRLNERRNALVGSLSGTLLLAASHEGILAFVDSAPDFWSIRSGFETLSASPMAPVSAIGRLEARVKRTSAAEPAARREAAQRLELARAALGEEGTPSPPALLPWELADTLDEIGDRATASELRLLLDEEMVPTEGRARQRWIRLLLASFSVDRLRTLVEGLPGSRRGMEHIDWTGPPMLVITDLVEALDAGGGLSSRDAPLLDALAEARPDLRTELDGLRKEQAGLEEGRNQSDADYAWDVFLAHASPDKPWCAELADALERAGLRVFLDSRGLDVASDWDAELSLAQQQSRITLVYVTSNTDEAWFQRAEIARAIAQKRFGDRQHEVLPIWGAEHHRPYGTEILVGIDPGPGLNHVVRQTLTVLEKRFGVVARERLGADELPECLTTGLRRAPPPEGVPSQLLVAHRQVVPFAGRVSEREELHLWADGEGVSVKLLHGSGGSGKTRLALQWLLERRDRGDVAGLLRGDASGATARELLERSGRTVVVIDHAETRPGLSAFLGELAQAWEGRAAAELRVLLVARHPGDWWGSLRVDGGVRSMLDAVKNLALLRLVTEVDRQAEFLRAGRAFADLLGTEVPAAPLDLDDPTYDNTLSVHVAVLLGALGHPTSAGRLLDGLVEREEAVWRHHGGGDVDWPPRKRAFERAHAALTLRGGAPTERSLEEWLPAVAGEHADAFGQLLAEHYEGSPDRWRDPLEPDLLGEHLVWRAASGAAGRDDGPLGADLVEAAMAGAAPPWPTAFTVLARAEPNHPEDVGPWLEALVRRDTPARAHAAFVGARAAGDRTASSTLGRRLARALEGSWDASLALAMSTEMPERTVSLRELAVWADSTLLAQPGLEVEEQARLANNLGRRLSDLGRHEDALQVSPESVRQYRALAESRPDAFLPDLAMSLNNLGNQLSALGRHEEALQSSQEAVLRYRALAESQPSALLPALAMSLNNLGTRLSALGRHEEALQATQEAMEHYRALAEARPDAFLPDLAASHYNLGLGLSALGRHQEALQATQEAVQLHRALAATHPDTLLSDLAMSLDNLGNMLSTLGRREEALQATQEAVQLHRALAATHPDTLLSDLAMSLDNLGNMLSTLGRREEALQASQEATEHYRVLADSRPDVFLLDLARSLNHLGNHLSELGRREEALQATQEAVQQHRALAASRPDTLLPGVAASLNNLGIRLSELGRPEEALQAAQEAVSHYRAMAASRPDAFLPDLAMGLNNLGSDLSSLGRYEEALRATQEAVQHYRALSESRPETFLPDLALSLGAHANALLAAGDPGAAAEVFCEGAGLVMPFFEHLPQAFEELVENLLRSSALAAEEADSAPAALPGLLARYWAVADPGGATGE